MIENYLSNIINMENFVDGMLIVDHNGVVVHLKNYREYSPFTEQEAVGKNLKELYPDLRLADSPVLRALRYGESTVNVEGTMVSYKGETIYLRTTTFPIKENETIIGAVNIVNYSQKERKEINVTPVGGRTYKTLYRLEDIIGRAPKVQELRQRIGRVAKTASSVLIYGETGTGKELVAQSIHTESSRKNKLFISQNCAAIPANLLESIFFGTAKGSYTGAENRPGIFEAADGGTVFLDEINSMDIGMQAKLLRALESKRITRIGGTQERQVDVRIIAATNEPPLSCMKNGQLRPDLFYRLGSVTIDIPPLRERLQDLSLLLGYYIAYYNREMHRNITGVSAEAEQILQGHLWPGNVRELRNAVEGAFNFCDGDVIEAEDLPQYILQVQKDRRLMESLLSPTSLGMRQTPFFDGIDQASAFHEATALCMDGERFGSLKEAVDAYERRVIVQEMKRARNFSRLAERLGITRQTLNQKLTKYGLHET